MAGMEHSILLVLLHSEKHCLFPFRAGCSRKKTKHLTLNLFPVKSEGFLPVSFRKHSDFSMTVPRDCDVP